MSMKTFNFDTGVKVYNNPHGPNGGKLSTNGVWVIPFDCEDVPEGSTFLYASGTDNLHAGNEAWMIRREIHNSGLISKYAYFRLPSTN